MEQTPPRIKVLSSLEKVFCDLPLSEFSEMREFTVFKNQKLVFQVAARNEVIPDGRYTSTLLPVSFDGELAPYFTARQVISVPAAYPTHYNCYDDEYYLRGPGLYPDMIRPLHYHGAIPIPYGLTQTLWIAADLPTDVAAGDYKLTVKLGDWASAEVSVKVLAEELPPQKTIHTEWLYSDCIAEYYRVEPFSEEHWRLLESFIRTAVNNGVNMILTPLHTVALDTYVGGERLTTQLLDIEVDEKGKYTFGFDKLGRWIDMCERIGVQYYEIPHFFTQWGAKHAPKTVGVKDGKMQRLFGWETDSMGDDYKNYLGQLLPALVAYLKKKGVYNRTYFHVSDEPPLAILDHYCACKDLIAPHVDNDRIIDALSNYAFYEKGVLTRPIPSTEDVEVFVNNKVENLWTYYCGAGGQKDVSGRYLSMPLYRTRIIGVQMYNAGIIGFLHWGYNFYHNGLSHDAINPIMHTDADYFFPAGDSHIVYPGDDGTALESIRLNAMREAMEDIRTLQLCEVKIGREAVLKIIEEECGGPLTFRTRPGADFIPRLRDRIIKVITE